MTYIFIDSQEESEINRLRLIEKLIDPFCRKYLAEAGLKSGQTVLEIGPGAGSMLKWLSVQVAPSGHLTAIERDTRFIKTLSLPNLTLKEESITESLLPKNHFDLIYARYVFQHISENGKVFESLFQSLKPNGKLVLIEPDFGDSKLTGSAYSHPSTNLSSVDRVYAAVRKVFELKKVQPSFGGSLPAELQKAGFEIQSVDPWLHLEEGGSEMAHLMKLSIQQLAPQLIETGLVEGTEIKQFLKICDQPKIWVLHYASIGVQASKPAH